MPLNKETKPIYPFLSYTRVYGRKWFLCLAAWEVLAGSPLLIWWRCLLLFCLASIIRKDEWFSDPIVCMHSIGTSSRENESGIVIMEYIGPKNTYTARQWIDLFAYIYIYIYIYICVCVCTCLSIGRLTEPCRPFYRFIPFKSFLPSSIAIHKALIDMGQMNGYKRRLLRQYFRLGNRVDRNHLESFHLYMCNTQPLRTNRKLHIANFKAEFNGFEFRIFLLKDMLPYQT